MKYQYWHASMFTVEQCKELNDNLIRDHAECELFHNPAEGATKTANVRLAHWKDAKKYLGKLEEYARLINEQYFGFDMYTMREMACVNFNQYHEENQGEYDWHYDGHINEIYDTKLTVILNTSTEPYEGGKFELFLSGGPRHIHQLDNAGTLLIFPGWIPHRVTPVTKGTRSSISIWLTGPNIR